VVLSETLLSALGEAFGNAEDDRDVRGIVLGTSGREFAGGADLAFLADCLGRARIEDVFHYIEFAQRVLHQIDRCCKPVVACVGGPALGGGLELALACDRILATASAVFAFPETGLGVFPSGGGTQRTPRRIGVDLARWMIYTGSPVTGVDAAAVGLVNGLVRTRGGEVFAEAGRWIIEGLPELRRPEPVARFVELADYFGRLRLDAVEEPQPGSSRLLCGAHARLREKGPMALRACERLLDGALRWPLAEGLRRELDEVRPIYATDDARVGMCAAIRGARPVFSSGET
jgi:enoyl-CoA hydratase/3-hydroxyacyl-CoA dehydrogenase